MPLKFLFDSLSDDYDQWYDTSEGSAVFAGEVECLRRLWDDSGIGRRLEVGVGTGRFARALGITHGIDISRPMALKAARRGVQICIGRAERLPFREQAFDAVLMALTLCFLENPENALQECRRVLRENGTLVLGTVPADSPWGRDYLRKGDEGHPVYAHARFHTTGETVHLLEQAGFRFRRGCSTLFRPPGTPPIGHPRVENGIIPEAGFVGLLFDTHHSGG